MVYAFWWPRSLCNICFDHTPHSLMLHWFRGWKGENAIDYGEQNTREPRVMDLWENKVRRMFCEQHKQQGSARCLKCGAWIVSKHCQAGVELDMYIRRAGRVFKKSICHSWTLCRVSQRSGNRIFLRPNNWFIWCLSFYHYLVVHVPRKVLINELV